MRLHRSEGDLATALVRLSDRHSADHEIHFVARDLAEWSHEHVRRLAGAARTLDPSLARDRTDLTPVTAFLERMTGLAVGRLHRPSLLLLADLRDVHCSAAGVSLDWEVLAQGAQAARHTELIELAADCHPQTLRQLRWANAQIKDLAAQAVLGS